MTLFWFIVIMVLLAVIGAIALVAVGKMEERRGRW